MQSFVYATCNSDLKKIYRNIVKNEYCESHDKIVGSVMQDIRYTMFILLSPMSFWTTSSIWFYSMAVVVHLGCVACREVVNHFWRCC